MVLHQRGIERTMVGVEAVVVGIGGAVEEEDEVKVEAKVEEEVMEEDEEVELQVEVLLHQELYHWKIVKSRCHYGIFDHLNLKVLEQWTQR